MFLSITQMGESATGFWKWTLIILVCLWVIFGIILKIKGDNKR